MHNLIAQVALVATGFFFATLGWRLHANRPFGLFAIATNLVAGGWAGWDVAGVLFRSFFAGVKAMAPWEGACWILGGFAGVVVAFVVTRLLALPPVRRAEVEQ